MRATCYYLNRLGQLFLLGLAFASVSCQLLDTPPDSRTERDSPHQSGPIRTYFTTPEMEPNRPGNIADKLAGYIAQARKSIDVAAFELDNQVITESLLEAVDRGVKVRLVTDSDYLNEHGPKALASAGVEIVDDKRSALMHNKFMIIDQRAVWTGSMNLTENCAYKNNNHGIMIVDERVADVYSTKFRWMFEQRKFGGKPSSSDRLPPNKIKLGNGAEVDIYFSTHDPVIDAILDELEMANKSIHILAFSFTHEKLGQALITAHREGVKVSAVLEKSQSAGQASLFPKLQDAGIDVVHDGNSRNMHHKCIIIDGQVTIAGSFNFTRSAEKTNDENLVIIRSKEIARQFESEFRQLREQAQPLSKSASSGQ